MNCHNAHRPVVRQCANCARDPNERQKCVWKWTTAVRTMTTTPPTIIIEAAFVAATHHRAKHTSRYFWIVSKIYEFNHRLRHRHQMWVAIMIIVSIANCHRWVCSAVRQAPAVIQIRQTHRTIGTLIRRPVTQIHKRNAKMASERQVRHRWCDAARFPVRIRCQKHRRPTVVFCAVQLVRTKCAVNRHLAGWNCLCCTPKLITHSIVRCCVPETCPPWI